MLSTPRELKPKSGIFLLFFLFVGLIATVPFGEASNVDGDVVYRVSRSYVIKNVGDHKSLSENLSFYLLGEMPELTNSELLWENICLSHGYENMIEEKTRDNRILKILGIDPLTPGETFEVSAVWDLRVGAFVKTCSEDVVGEIPNSLIDRYTGPVEGVWHTENPEIKEKALELTENISNYCEKAKSIFNFVQEHLEYEVQTEFRGDLWAYSNGRGDCSEYAALFVTLARASGIPAKFASGYLYSFEESELSTTGLSEYGHAWTYIYLPNLAWVPVDPTETRGSGGGGAFARLTKRHILGLVSNGSNMGGDESPGPPGAKLNYQYYKGKRTKVEFVQEESGHLIRPLVATDIRLAGQVFREENRSVEYSIEIFNRGDRKVSDLDLTIRFDNGSVGAYDKVADVLEPGEHVTRNLTVIFPEYLENVDTGLTFKATYDSEVYGEFEAQVRGHVTIEFPSENSSKNPVDDFFELVKSNFFLFAVMIVVFIVGFVVIW